MTVLVGEAESRALKWPRVQLGDVAEQCLGKMLDAKKNKGRPLKYLRNPNVQWFKVDVSDLKEMLFEEHEMNRFGLLEGDVVVCEGGEAGRAAIWEGQVRDVKFQKAIHRVRCGPKLHNRFLVHRLMADYHSGRLAEYYTGVTIKHLTGRDLSRYEFELPPVEQQKRIAAILDKADALRAKRRKALEQLDALAQAIFIEMFGADECPFFELGEALEFITSGGRGWAKYYSEQGARFIRSYDVQMNHISDAEPIYVAAPDNAEARRTIVRQGDVLLTITGSKIGRVSPVSKKFDGAYVSQHVAILRGDACRIDSDFLSYYLSLPAGGQRQIEKSQYGQTKPGLNFEQIKKFRVPDVSIEIQREFTRRLKTIEELRQAQTRHLVASESLFSSLQHRAFRGEL